MSSMPICMTCAYWRKNALRRAQKEYGECSGLLAADAIELVEIWSYAPVGVETREDFGCRLWKSRQEQKPG